MEAMKNCDTCLWSVIKGSTSCKICDKNSNTANPYPEWEPVIRYFDNPEAWVSVEEDIVNHPKHYTVHPSGVECIQITEHMNFCLGNAMKYIWRAGDKHDTPLEDLKKAKWYIEREIARLEKE